MRQHAIIDRMSAFAEEIAEREGVSGQTLDIELWRFADLSARVEFEPEDKVDFALALPSDTADQVKAKFLAYLDSNCIDALAKAREEINKLDRPTDSATAPVPPPDNDAKKK